MTRIIIDTTKPDLLIVDGQNVGAPPPPNQPPDDPPINTSWEEICGGSIIAPANAGHIWVGPYAATQPNTVTVDTPPVDDPWYVYGFENGKYTLMLEHFDANWPIHKRVYWLEADGSQREFYNGTATTVKINIGSGRAGKRFYVEITHPNGDEQANGNGMINQRYHMLGQEA